MADPNDSIAYLRSLVERMPENKDLPKPQFFMDPRSLSMANILKGGATNTLNWFDAVRGNGQEAKPGEGYGFAATGLTPEDVVVPTGIGAMGLKALALRETLDRPSIADSARAKYLEWKHPDDKPSISGGEGQWNSAKYLAEADRMARENPHSIRSAAEPIATDPSATVINQYARNLYGTHTDVLNRINDLLKQAPSPERDAALAQYRQMRFRTASLLDELDPPEFSPANERGTPRDRFRLVSDQSLADILKRGNY
jgi:hypothetical protein